MKVVTLFFLGCTFGMWSAEHQVKESLDQWNPPWYNQQEESWQRIVPTLIEDETVARNEQSSSDNNGRSSNKTTTSVDDGEEPFSLGIDGFSNAFFTIMMILIIILITSALGYLIYTYFRQVKPLTKNNNVDSSSSKRLSARAEERLPALLDLNNTDLEAGLSQAQAKKDWRSVIIYAYALGLITADQKQLIYLHPASTNRQYMKEISERGSSHHISLFAPLLHRFEDTYFGSHPAHASLAAAQIEDLAQFRRLATKNEQVSI